MRRLGIIVLVLFFGCSFNSGAAQDISLARWPYELNHGKYTEANAR